MAVGDITKTEFGTVEEISPPTPNVQTISGPQFESQRQQQTINRLQAEGYEFIPDQPTEEPVEILDPLDIYDDKQLIEDREFSPHEYFNQFGEGSMAPEKFSRLKKIFGAKLQQGISARNVAEFAIRATKGLPENLARLAEGMGQVIDRAAIRPVVGMVAGAISEFLPGADQRRQIIADWIDRGGAELVAGLEAEAVVLSEGLITLWDKTRVMVRGQPLSDTEAGKLLTDWAARTKQLQEVLAGKGAVFNAAEVARQEGVEIDPQAIENITAGGPMSIVLFGGVFKVVNSLGRTILTAPSRTAAAKAVARLRSTQAAAQVATRVERAAATQETKAFRAAALEAEKTGVVGEAAGVESAQAAWARSSEILRQAESRTASAQTALRAAETAVGESKAAQGLLAADELAAARAQVSAAEQALKTGPRNAQREAALNDAITQLQAAENAAKQVKFAESIDFLRRAQGKFSEAMQAVPTGVIGGALISGGRALEKLAGPYESIAKFTRMIRPLGIPVGQLFAPIARGVAIGARAVGAAERRLGEAIVSPTPSIVGQRLQDWINITSDAMKPVAIGGTIDYGFAVGTAKSDAEAREMPAIAAGLGALAGGIRAVPRLATAEVIAPRRAPVKSMPSPAYRENPTLDSMHSQAMAKTSSELQAKVNFVREISKQFNGRVYVTPDIETFVRVLDELWKQQNPGTSLTPDVTAAHRLAAQQNGMFSTSILGPDGQPQNIAIIRNPASIGHELGHVIESVLPDRINTELDTQVRQSISPENWERAGDYYVSRLIGEESRAQDPRNWREVLQEFVDIDSDTYLAREFRAENIDVAFRNRGEAFATTPDLYRRLIQWLGIVAERAGVDFGAVSPTLGFPVSIEAMTRGEREARRVIESPAQQLLFETRAERLQGLGQPPIITQRTPAGLPVITPPEGAPIPAPPIIEPGASERQIVEQLPVETPVVPPKSPIREPMSPQAVGQVLLEARRTGEGVLLNRLGAPDTPAADLYARGHAGQLRVLRREVIEAWRDMPQEAKINLPKVIFPEKIVQTKAKGPQVQGYVPEIFAANAHRLAKALSEARQAELSPYPIDATTKTFTPESWRMLYNDLSIFVQNQKSGLTGAGERLIVPREAQEFGFEAPAQLPGEFMGLPQRNADFISMLFGFKLPETPRVRAEKMPQAIAGQLISEATRPGRVSLPVPETRAKEFPAPWEGWQIREVNPVRRAIESALGKRTPELFEAWQHINIRDILTIERAPEAAEFRGKSVALIAGFQPSNKKGAIKAAAVRTTTGKIFTGEIHAIAFNKAYKEGFQGKISDQGFVDDAGEFLTREQAMQRAEEIGQYTKTPTDVRLAEISEEKPGLEALRFKKGRQFQPATEAGRKFSAQGYKFERAGTPAVPAIIAYNSKGLPIGEIQAKRSSPREAFIGTIRVAKPERGKGLSKVLYRELGQLLKETIQPGEELQLTGEIVSPRAAAARAEVFPETEFTGAFGERLSAAEAPRRLEEGELGVQAISRITPEMQFQPILEPKTDPQKVVSMTADQWLDFTRAYRGKYVGGLTGYAYDLGLQVKTIDDAVAIREAGLMLRDSGTELMKAGDMEAAMSVISKAQAMREAYEAATGENFEGKPGGSAEFIRKHFDPTFQPPLKTK